MLCLCSTIALCTSVQGQDSTRSDTTPPTTTNPLAGFSTEQIFSSLPEPDLGFDSLVNLPVEERNWLERLHEPPTLRYISVDTMFLYLSHPNSVPLGYTSVGEGPPDNKPLATTRDISDNRNRAELRVTIGKEWDEKYACELTYFGSAEYEGESDLEGDFFGVAAPGDVGNLADWFSAQTISGSLAASIHSGEMNHFYFSESVPGLKFLHGFRYLYFQERLNLVAENFGNISHLRDQVTNNLFGGQIGFRYTRERRIFRIETQMKTGIYGNQVVGRQFLGDNSDNSIIRNSSTTAGQVAYVSEAGITLYTRLNEHWLLQAGYNVFVFQGVGRAADNLNFSTAPSVDLHTNSNAILHGPSAGFTYEF